MRKLFIIMALYLGFIGVSASAQNQNQPPSSNGMLSSPSDRNSRDHLKSMCDLDYANSCRNLGIMWERGLEGESNIAEAENYYSQSCRLKSRKGCTDFARLLVADSNPFEKRKRGISILGRNCDLNDYQACSVLGNVSLAAGLYDNANYLFKRACDAGGHANACHNLAITYTRKKNPDPAKAIEYYRRACDLGLTTACNR